MVKPWNAGKIPMLLMHPASGGHGLNLQAGGHIIVFFDIPWSLELYLQFIGRLARQGQKHRVTVFLLVCKGTLDNVVVDALQAKNDAQNMLFRLLKRMRAKFKRALKRAKMEAEQMTAKDHEMMVDVLAATDSDDDDRLLEEELATADDEL
jgi:superfamily II DNA/RNA helicase